MKTPLLTIILGINLIATSAFASGTTTKPPVCEKESIQAAALFFQANEPVATIKDLLASKITTTHSTKAKNSFFKDLSIAGSDAYVIKFNTSKYNYREKIYVLAIKFDGHCYISSVSSPGLF